MSNSISKAFMNWSGGKDSSLALYHALKDPSLRIESLLTSVNSHFGRISMHGVRESLLDLQAESIGLPLRKLYLPEQPSMEEYNQAMQAIMDAYIEEKFEISVFGDIFLEDLRAYREEKIKTAGLRATFPIWKRNTTELIHEFIDLGFKTILVCIKADLLDKSFAGRVIDHDFLKDLPDTVDPCGENGEFHTFVFDGPIFEKPVPFEVGETVFKSYDNPQADKSGKEKMGFWFTDLK